LAPEYARNFENLLGFFFPVDLPLRSLLKKGPNFGSFSLILNELQ